MDRASRFVPVAAIGLAGIAAATAATGVAPARIVTDFGVGVILSVAGAVAWQRRPRSGVGPLVALTGLLWLLGSILPVALYLHRAALAALFHSYPSGKLGRRSDQILVPVGRAGTVGGLAPPTRGPAEPSCSVTAEGRAVAVSPVRRLSACSPPQRPPQPGSAPSPRRRPPDG